MTNEERLKAAEEQLAYWRQQKEYAERQEWMWLGAVETLKGIANYELQTTSEKAEGAGEESSG